MAKSKYLLLLAPLLLSSCTSIQYVKTRDNQLVTQDNKTVHIVGNPPVECYLAGFANTSGYFMYQDDDGTIFIDDYGRGTIELQGDVVCKLLNETK